MRRRLPLLALVAVLAVAAWFFVVRGGSSAPAPHGPRATAVIGSGTGAVGVSPNGVILSRPPPAGSSLPRLPLAKPPRSGRLAGPMLQQARILGAVPPALRRFLARSHYGESGVDVELTSGIELRFGDASQAAPKWRAAAAVLADPSITGLDYVDLQAPRNPAIYGSGHSLPPTP